MSKNGDKIDRLRKKIDALAQQAITTIESKRLGDSVTETIRRRTRQGYGVDSAGNRTKLKALTDEYVETRRRYSDDLSEFTTPKKSNLTATGQMLDAMRGVASRGRIEVEIAGSRKPGLGGQRSKISNSTLARYVQEMGRQFFGLTKPERTGLVRQVKLIFLRALRAGLNTNK